MAVKKIDLTGLWRLGQGTPIFEVVHDLKDANRFTFDRIDGDRKSFYGHGLVEGEQVLISWRSTMWLGHGSDRSTAIERDLIGGQAIEVRWQAAMPAWQTVSN